MNAIANAADKANGAGVTPMTQHWCPSDLQRLRNYLRGVLLGKTEQIDLVLACLLAGGHLLLDDLPGTGKTTLAKAVADGLGGRLSRIQCTPDLMPADVTGFSVLNQQTREFEFRPGPVFADVLLADELNRTTPRTQSALLEAMAERQVSVDGESRPLSPTFFVIATQNPIDSHGAYPLPEAQLDRFSIKLKIGYPDRDAQRAILRRTLKPIDTPETNGPSTATENSLHHAPEEVSDVDLADLQRIAESITVHARVDDYIIDLVEATRDDPAIELGVSPRGMLHWQAVARGWAMLQGRMFVTPSDVAHVAQPVLSVRLLTREPDVDAVISRILDRVPAPRYE